jgi:phosphate:Na+ symporter
MQSSSLVSVITISFLSAGLLELSSAIGIIFGANLGTTTGAWLVAGFGLKVNLSAYAMPMLVFGILLIFQKPKNLKGAGYILTGLGFLFLGIHYMKEGFDSFGQTINLAEYSIAGYPGVFAFAGIGVLATVVMQSSHATLVLILAALAAQQISYENALALAIGSNVGTTITAIIGSLGSSADGKRLAIAHLVFNVVTGIIAIVGIYQLMRFVGWVSAYLGIAAENYTLQLAVFHSVFNLLGIIVMLPLLNWLVKFLERLFADQPFEVEQPVYLSEATRSMPEAAVEAVRKETARLYDLAVSVITDGLSIQRDALQSGKKPKQVVKQSSAVIDEDIDTLYETKLKSLYGKIVEFVIHAKGGYAEGRLKEELHELRNAGQHVIEAVKGVKHFKKNLTRSIRSDNVYIRKQYDLLRRLIVRVLREIDTVRSTPEESESILSLDQVKLDVGKKTENISDGLDDLIRQEHITIPMATSLMNDLSYCKEICWDLLEAGATLFSAPDLHEKAAMRSIALDEQEITEMMKSKEQDAVT